MGRSIKKGPFVAYHLLKKINTMNTNGKKDVIKTWSRASMILPDIFIDQDIPENMYKVANLDSNSIEEKVLDLLNSNIVLQKHNKKN